MSDFFQKEDSNSNTKELNDFAASYDLYFSRIHFFVSRLIGDSEQSKDLAADVFVKLWERWGSFESAEHIRSWLYVTAKNAALTWVSVSRRRAIIRKEVSRQVEISETQVEQSMALAELMKEIYDQALELPPQSRQVFNLIYLEGKSTREIASILSIAPKTVLNYKLNIIQKLRAILLKKGLITSSTLLLLCKKIFF
jgi:RNA polymerase sigma factor (sigma-70 family)